MLIVYRNGSTIHAKENCAAFPGRHFPLFCFLGPIQFGVSPQHFCLTLNLIRKSKLFRKSRRCQLLIQFSEFQCYETSFLVLTMFCVNDGSNISNLYPRSRFEIEYKRLGEYEWGKLRMRRILILNSFYTDTLTFIVMLNGAGKINKL